MFAKRKILVVEDNQMNRELLCEILSADYQVLEAENGEEALEVLQEQAEEISLILLDIMMPVMDGYTFLSLLKENDAFSSIPVIVTTQNDAEADEVAALSHGASDFVPKPYRPRIILHRVASIIRLRETAAMINLFRHDRLTGLYSKEFFYQKVREVLTNNPEKEYDILCSDVVNFKLVNDIFGSQTGDQLLCILADACRSYIADDGLCGRLNADQFICLKEHQAEYSDAEFAKICEEASHQARLKNMVMKWGVYPVTDRSLSVEQMCDRAVLAARSIKGQYGKYVTIYGDELRGKLLREQAITESMEPALKEGQFEIYLQPIYRIEDGSLKGAEALVRWNHPEWGLLPPIQFIPLFERNGFITTLDRFVWDRACAVMRDWDDRGFVPFSISVNVSRADIYNADLVDILQKTIQKYDLPASRLHLEITESAYTETPQQIIDTARSLRELGFVIEMDDFGSGYSSLNMLDQLPIDTLKLDGQFIQGEMEKPADKGILQFIMNLARWMNINIVAEGVETYEQLERLQKFACECAQGYYFARPMPVAEFEKLLKKQA